MRVNKNIDINFINNLYNVNSLDLLKLCLIIVYKTFLILFFIVIPKRLTELIFELISGKVIIPLIIIYLFSQYNVPIDGTGELINLITGGLLSSGILYYKYKKDVINKVINKNDRG